MTYLLVTEASKKDLLCPLERVPYIYYLFYFRKNLHETTTLINSSSEISPITLLYISKLAFKVQKTDIGAQKIHSSILNTFEMVWTHF